MAKESAQTELWPALPYSEWQPTRDTLHMWTQIVGKTRLHLTPLVNHWWNVTLYLSARGLSTSPMYWNDQVFEIEFDFLQRELLITRGDGEKRVLKLYPRSVADFFAEYISALRSLGIDVTLHTKPDEVSDPIPFEQDNQHASYDHVFVNRFWRILLNSDRLFKQFRSGFIGKCSPVHFYWGSFDLAVTRFSGRSAPERKEMDGVQREAYSHEVISCGFWPGDERLKEAAFYAYAAPVPAGLDKEPIRPKAAFFHPTMGEFLLKYEDVSRAESPDAAVLDFCQSTYEAAAKLANWDRNSLERK